MNNDNERALQLATKAGHILLENGAEISRVEDTMERIATAYGVEEKSFFVLSNGIISTGKEYAKAEFIPIKGMQLSRVVEVNQLSRDVTSGKCSLDELATRLESIGNSASKPWWQQVLGSALGVSAFCILFRGSLIDSAATFVVGLLLGVFMAFAGSKLPRIFGNLLGGMVGGLLCILSVRLGFGEHLPNMITGTIICLVPGIPFTNGMRDLANEDYLAGFTRLLDAFLVFLCIAMGVVLSFLVEEMFTGALIDLEAPVADAFTSQWYMQLLAAFVGTMGFAVLFGVPNKYNLHCGIVGAAGSAMYLFTGSAFLAALVIALASHLLAIARRCPVTVFLICGIIPLVPGGSIFWTAYYLVSKQLAKAATTGFMSIEATVAIAGGIIVMGTIFAKIMKNLKR